MRRCPNCLELKPSRSFNYISDKEYIQGCYCGTCRVADEVFDAWVNKILKGVFIPQHIKPVTRYFDPNLVSPIKP